MGDPCIWICIGASTSDTDDYVIGLNYHMESDRTRIACFPFSKIEFLGNLCGT